MYGLYFSYARAMNSQSVAYFNDNTDAIAKTLVKGIVRYFEIQGDSMVRQFGAVDLVR